MDRDEAIRKLMDIELRYRWVARWLREIHLLLIDGRIREACMRLGELRRRVYGRVLMGSTEWYRCYVELEELERGLCG